MHRKLVPQDASKLTAFVRFGGSGCTGGSRASRLIIRFVYILQRVGKGLNIKSKNTTQR